MITYPWHRRRLGAAAAGFALLAVAAVAGVAGCGGASHSSSSVSGTGAKVARPATDVGAPAAAAGEQAKPQQAPTSGGGNGATTPTTPIITERSIIHTGDITVRVPDVDTAAAQAEALATAAGGYVGGDNRQIDAGRSSAMLTLRVPAARFDATLSAVANLGTETGRTVSTQDVTSQVIDVAARLRSEQASVDRVRALLAQATSIGEIVSIESELTQRESDLESLESQQANLNDLTALSTITAELLGPQAKAAATTKTTGFVGGVSRGWHAFVASMTWLVSVLGAILPFVAAIGLVTWIVRVLMRRLQARRIGIAGPAPAPAGPPSPPAAPPEG